MTRTAPSGPRVPSHARVRRTGTAGLVAATAVAAGLGLIGLIGTAPSASAATRLGGVDMQRGCDTQWPGYGLAAHVNNPNDAYSWRCWAPFDHTTYQIDVKRECITQFGAGAYQGLGNSRDPYSWFCQR